MNTPIFYLDMLIQDFQVVILINPCQKKIHLLISWFFEFFKYWLLFSVPK